MGGEKLRLEWMYAEELDGNPRNWHLHPYAQEAALRDAKEEVGWAGALLYNERTRRLIDGHLRKKSREEERKNPGPRRLMVGRRGGKNSRHTRSDRNDGASRQECT